MEVFIPNGNRKAAFFGLSDRVIVIILKFENLVFLRNVFLLLLFTKTDGSLSNIASDLDIKRFLDSFREVWVIKFNFYVHSP